MHVCIHIYVAAKQLPPGKSKRVRGEGVHDKRCIKEVGDSTGDTLGSREAQLMQWRGVGGAKALQWVGT